MKKPWKRLTVCLSEKEYRSLRELAGKAGMSMSAFIRLILGDFSLKDDVDKSNSAKSS